MLGLPTYILTPGFSFSYFLSHILIPNILFPFNMLGLRRVGHFSWRRVLLFGSAFTVFWIFVFSLTPITSPLPPYTGQYEVGVLDIETEVEKRVIHDAVLKESGQPAFEVCTFFRLYFFRLHFFILASSYFALKSPFSPS